MRSKKTFIGFGASLAAVALVATGCATGGAPDPSAAGTELTSLRDQLKDTEKLASAREKEIANLSRELDRARSTDVSARPPATSPSGDLLPSAARPGECYAKVHVPAKFEAKTERILKREAGQRIDIVPAVYEWGTETVVVKEASEKLELVPATYGWVEEKVLVKPASTKIEEVPAVYGVVEEKVLVAPARTEWKTGRGAKERIDHATGEILCLVEIPAEYKTVKKRVIKSPATTRTIQIPAEYKTLKKRVMKTPPTTRKIPIPAVTETVKVRKLVKPAQEKRIDIPAEYEVVNQRVKVSESTLAWRTVLCETNTTPGLVAELQRALQRAGHSPGPIDGALGNQTLTAVQSYQRSKGLATGGVTLATLESLGLKLGR